jgi:hypothetical protein
MRNGSTDPDALAKAAPGTLVEHTVDHRLIRSPDLRVVLRLENGKVNEVAFHFEPDLGVSLSQLLPIFGRYQIVAESKTSSVRWATGTDPTTVYATLLSSRVAPEARVIVVRVRNR